MARKKRSERREAKKFGLILPVVLLGFAGLFYWRDRALVAGILAAAAPVVLTLAFLAPKLWLGVFRQWMKLAEVLSWFMTRLILSVFFFLVLTPFGLVMRLFGKRPLDLKWKVDKPTYWVEKEPGEFTLERYGKQY